MVVYVSRTLQLVDLVKLQRVFVLGAAGYLLDGLIGHCLEGFVWGLFMADFVGNDPLNSWPGLFLWLLLASPEIWTTRLADKPQWSPLTSDGILAALSETTQAKPFFQRLFLVWLDVCFSFIIYLVMSQLLC